MFTFGRASSYRFEPRFGAPKQGNFALQQTGFFIYFMEEHPRFHPAIGAGCTVFLTNERRLAPVPGLRVMEIMTYAT